MSRKTKNKPRPGSVLRPCHICGGIVNFAPWKNAPRKSRGGKPWHWVNEDGTHHVHGFSAPAERPFSADEGRVAVEIKYVAWGKAQAARDDCKIVPDCRPGGNIILDFK